MRKPIGDMFDDPVAPDETSPEFKQEQFELYKAMGWAPEDIVEADTRAEYKEWLQKQ